jgi:hypothetical protein
MNREYEAHWQVMLVSDLDPGSEAEYRGSFNGVERALHHAEDLDAHSNERHIYVVEKWADIGLFDHRVALLWGGDWYLPMVGGIGDLMLGLDDHSVRG